MEENRKVKISMSIVLLIISIIIIFIMAYFLFDFSKQINESEKEINSLNSKISDLEKSVSNYEEKMESISNTINSNTENKKEISVSTSSSNNYAEITEKLDNNSLLSVTDAINNNNGTYTLKGKIITIDKSREQIAEFPFYKETGEYKQITVSEKTKCTYLEDSNNEKNDTVENVFSKKLAFDGGQYGSSFNFEFEDNKCVLVYQVNTGH